MRLLKPVGLAITLLAVSAGGLRSQNPELAKDLAEEGIVNEAKIEFIKVLRDPSKKSSYDTAEFYLGYLDFKSQSYELALKHWDTLLKEYPNSPYAQRAKNSMEITYQLLEKQQQVASEDLEISALFDNADFVVDEPLKVWIDTSYLPGGDLAIESLEQVVTRFPKTPQAARALFREALVCYGWGKEGIGEHSKPSGYGFQFNLYYNSDYPEAVAYVGKIEGILARLESDYPETRYSVPVAFLIGQAYWALARSGAREDKQGRTYSEKAKTYLEKVLALTSEDNGSIYRQLAEWRLKK
jgi:tetratricopeptide (TPR) repeat protein